MSKVYFMSDPHWGHRNICKYRPFKTPEEHDITIFENVMDVVTKRDTLWILGDTCFSIDSLEYIKQISNTVQRLRLILGNHCLEGRLKVGDYLACGENIDIQGFCSYKNFWISHCPIHPDEMRGKKGNIHGHTHNKKINDSRYRCVSMEQIGYKPIDFLELKEEFEVML